MSKRNTPEANAAIEKLQSAGFDFAEADMIYHGDMLGPALGARTATLITSLREALAKAREALASELDNRGEEFDDAYAVPVAPVIKAIDALNPSRKETI